MTGRLSGKTAIVTGAGEGIGRAIARRFGEEGARLALVELDPARLAAVQAEFDAAGVPQIGLSGDATEPALATEAVARATEAFGQVDILVNNVGGARPGRIWDIDADDWDAVMRINLRPTFLFSKAVLPQMLARKWGRIICMSSGAREGTPWMATGAGGVPYATTKAGIHGFIRQLSLEVAREGITVNAIAPGPINTAGAGPYFSKVDNSGDPYSPSRLTPAGRLGEPVEIADAAVFLASDESAYISGVTLPVTGGR